jgi:adenylate cyclase
VLTLRSCGISNTTVLDCLSRGQPRTVILMTDPEGTRKLEAILAADVAEYSRLMQDDDEATVATLDAYRAVFREKIQAYRGRVVDMSGDSVLAVFDAATGAVRAAFEIQSVLSERNEPLSEKRRMRFRIGVNLGEVIEKPDGTVYGDGVNVAARLESIGEPGGVTVSGTVFDQVKSRLPMGFDFVGEQEVKNIAELVRAYRVVAEGTPASGHRLNFRLRHRGRHRLLILAIGVLVAVALTASWLWSRTPKQFPITNNRLAVLPFVSMSASGEDEYFVDGMTEELISRLSRVKGVDVIARTSIASYKGTKKKIAEIGSELNVGTVLEGSVRKAGNKIRVTAQLINASNDAHLWSEDYDRELKDIFTVQTDIAQHVTNALTAKFAATANLGNVHVQEPKDSGTTNLDAYNAYLKGRFYYNKGTVPDLYKAIPYFNEAAKLDPSYALPHAGLADTYANIIGYEGATDELYAKTKASALKALELNESLAEAHTSLGIVKAFYEYDLPGAGEAFRRAIALNPNSAMTHDWYSFYLLFFPRWDEAIAIQRRAVQLDPLAIIISTDLGWVLEHADRWDEAIEHLRETLKLDPGNAMLLGALGLAYRGKGMYPEALATFQKRIDTSGPDAEILCFMAQTYASSGDTAKALEILKEAKVLTKKQPGHAWDVAQTYRTLASRDKQFKDDMFTWLDKALEEHPMGLVFTSAPEWEPFRSDPRLIAFRKKIGLPQ